MPSIHVGDYGFGYFSPCEERQLEAFHRRNPRHRFIRGNHDHPDLIAKAPGYIADGSVSGAVLMIGGADGVLRNWRTGLSREDMADITRALVEAPCRPTVVISHDCPQVAAARLCAERDPGARALRNSPTRAFFSEVLAITRPAVWIFGHWHHPWAAEIEGTHFRCLGFGEAIVMPLPLAQGI